MCLFYRLIFNITQLIPCCKEKEITDFTTDFIVCMYICAYTLHVYILCVYTHVCADIYIYYKHMYTRCIYLIYIASCCCFIISVNFFFSFF